MDSLHDTSMVRTSAKIQPTVTSETPRNIPTTRSIATTSSSIDDSESKFPTIIVASAAAVAGVVFMATAVVVWKRKRRRRDNVEMGNTALFARTTINTLAVTSPIQAKTALGTLVANITDMRKYPISVPGKSRLSEGDIVQLETIAEGGFSRIMRVELRGEILSRVQIPKAVAKFMDGNPSEV